MSLASSTRHDDNNRPSRPFDRVPDEIILAILHHVPSDDLAQSVQRVSRRLHHLSSEPQLWLDRCRRDFVYWNAEHRALLERGGGEKTSWKHMWLERKRGDAATADDFAHILRTKTHRAKYAGRICQRGLDAKDYLLAQYAAEENDNDNDNDKKTDDALARRYYADSVLGSIHRGLAVAAWAKIRQTDFAGHSGLDRGVAAFDMFVLHDGEGDMDWTEAKLDALAEEFQVEFHKRENKKVLNASPREKALALLEWVRLRNLVGLSSPDRTYRYIRNCLLGQALADPKHPSLPLVSCVIYVSLARRIGLEAYCCTVPGQVHVTVLAPRGYTLDGKLLTAREREQQRPKMHVSASSPAIPTLAQNTQAQAQTTTNATQSTTGQTQTLRDDNTRMFLDPFSKPGEISLSQMRQTVTVLRWGQDGLGLGGSAETTLLPAPTTAMVLRLATNIEASWAQYHHGGAVGGALPTAHAALPNANASNAINATEEERQRGRWLARGDGLLNLDALKYAASWASVLMRPLLSAGSEWDRKLDSLLSQLLHLFPMDVWMIPQYLVPLYAARERAQMVPGIPQWQQQQQQQQQRRRGVQWASPGLVADVVRNLDARQPSVRRRYTQELCALVQFRVGQVVRHRRYGTVCVVTGWEVFQAKEDDVDVCGGSRKTAFYECLSLQTERMRIAQWSLERVTDPAAVPQGIFFRAGRAFKRFDEATCTFVSNVREQFPDD